MPEDDYQLFIRSIFDSGVGRWDGYGYTKEDEDFFEARIDFAPVFHDYGGYTYVGLPDDAIEVEPTMLETGTEFRAEFTLEEFTTQDHIRQTMDDIKEMLLEKNRSYGDSAINPVRIFSQASPEEQLLVRIDDKLSRFARGHDYMGDDDIDDLIGYLVLLKIARKTL